MIAVDTNVVLRLLLADDLPQLRTVEAMLSEGRIFIPLTVMLETGWVLASRYRMGRADLATAMEMILDLDRVEIARPEQVRWAIHRFRDGADWADMIHLVAAGKLDAFATFDAAMARAAGSQPPVPVETLA